MSIDRVRALALGLPREGRLALAMELLESIDADDGGAAQASEDEIGRRVERLDRGEAELLPNADVLRRIGRAARS